MPRNTCRYAYPGIDDPLWIIQKGLHIPAHGTAPLHPNRPPFGPTAPQPSTIRAAQDITERPHAPSGVAALMSDHSKTPYSTPGMEFSSGRGVVWGRRGKQLKFALG